MASSEYLNEENQNRDIIAQQFDTKTFLTELEYSLKGFRFDNETKTYVSFKEEGYLNAQGCKQVINIIKGIIGNINASSSLKEYEIYNMRSELYHNLLFVLATNHAKYDLNSYHLQTVLDMIDRAAFLFLSRTKDGNFFQKFHNYFTRKETQVYTQREEQQPTKKNKFSV